MLQVILYSFYGFLFLTLIGFCLGMFVAMAYGKGKLKVEINHIIFFVICVLSIIIKTEVFLIPGTLYIILTIIDYIKYKKNHHYKLFKKSSVI